MQARRRVLIVNDTQDCGAPYGPLFESIGEVTEDVDSFKLNSEQFSLIVFTGGSDVSPDLYGDTSPDGVCRSDPERDKMEAALFNFARHRVNIKMVGICRGMQFLNVMSGGKLIHDLKGHGGLNHNVLARDAEEPFIVNSWHHQMCVPHKETHILAWSKTNLSDRYIGNKDEPIDYKGPEVEAIYIPQYQAIGVQWHPETIKPDSGDKSRSWFKFLIKDIISKNVHEFKRLYLGLAYTKLFIKGA